MSERIGKCFLEGVDHEHEGTADCLLALKRKRQEECVHVCVFDPQPQHGRERDSCLHCSSSCIGICCKTAMYNVQWNNLWFSWKLELGVVHFNATHKGYMYNNVPSPQYCVVVMRSWISPIYVPSSVISHPFRGFLPIT